ncbi:XLF-domain-containing protein [Hypoxylon trugodes]|uniref:XLF-domain-containing protein n=1 Tax=Hypoxylon trugodes TaxID=326681 RepID=UPI00218FD0A3|nr:XLF-domain-containing protein [Hypoxylon trugodes]KAI1384173.1 XLF-domain-containing protein [Hypoxylon trugodes]
MEMASGSKWHPLPAFPDLPALMISPRFGTSSYTFHVTDLANVWVEALDRKGILLRSLQENTSIDLSDGDPNQWIVFLSKLNAAFDPASPDHPTTSLSISASSADRTVEGGLVLHVTCVLPEPLKPLKWPIYLTKCPPVGLASELVLPLIQAHHLRTLEIEDLVTRLKEKDAVITKLVDKLEANQTGLEYVFSSLSGKRKLSRTRAEQHVKGLAAFNEDEWRTGATSNQQFPPDVSSLMHKFFAETGLQCNMNPEVAPSAQLNDWWTKLSSHPTAAIIPQKETPEKPQDTPPSDSNTTKDGDDDFQVQAIPSDLQSRRRRYAGAGAADENTDDDEDGPVKVSGSPPAPAQQKPRSRIGAVGGKNKASRDISASQSSQTVPADDEDTPSESETEPAKREPQNRTNNRIGTIGKSKESSPPANASSPIPLPSKDDDETASGSDSEGHNEGPSDAQTRSSPPHTANQPKRAGLGRIGGKSKARATPEPREELKVASPKVGSPLTTTSPAKPVARKIGAIGKKPDIDGKRPRSESPLVAAEPETEEQRTERRRAELAKELERKAAAPTKKKRRF